MRLPNREKAYIPRETLADSLLSDSHPIGRAKARFFRRQGFREGDLRVLQQALLEVAYNGEVTERIASEYGEKYVVEGRVFSPVGEEIELRTVWIVEAGDERPRFVTAYPA